MALQGSSSVPFNGLHLSSKRRQATPLLIGTAAFFVWSISSS